MIVGISRDKPVEFLVLMVIVGIPVIVWLSRPGRLSRRGCTYLNLIREKWGWLREVCHGPDGTRRLPPEYSESPSWRAPSGVLWRTPSSARRTPRIPTPVELAAAGARVVAAEAEGVEAVVVVEHAAAVRAGC
jgi:hypothetical protein